MNIELNQLIDTNLNLIFISVDQKLHSSLFVENEEIVASIIEVMLSHEFIETESDKEVFFLTEEGYNVLEDGGWHNVM